MKIDKAELAKRLDHALDAVLVVRLALGGTAAPAMPDDAMDAALALHEGFQEARRDFVAALEAAQRGGADDEAILRIEAAAHAMVGLAVEVVWRLGFIVQGGTRG